MDIKETIWRAVFLNLCFCISVAQLRAEKDELQSGLLSHKLAAKSIALLEAGNYESGEALLREAIDKNPCDIGFRKRQRFKVSQDALTWGDSQVRQMIKDRPNMQEHLAHDDRLLSLARDLYAGAFFGKRIRWESQDPMRFLSEIWPPTDESLGAICIRRTELSMLGQFTARPFEELWSSFFFEMHNICNSDQFSTLDELGRKGQISKREFVKRTFIAEACAVQETRGFYIREYLPWAAARKIPTNPVLWYTDGWWGTKEDCFNRIPSNSYYPWRAYGNQYDDWANSHLATVSSIDGSQLSVKNLKPLKNFSYVNSDLASKVISNASKYGSKDVTMFSKKLLLDLERAGAN